MTINRRVFLKNVFRIGGIAAIFRLGGSKLIDECFAGNYFISGHGVGGGGEGVSWDDWDEEEEGTLASSDTYVCLFENPIAGGNEVGQGGGLSENSRTLVEYGNAPGVPGATGSPPSRLLDGLSDWFFSNDTWFNPFFAGQTKYFLCLKINVTAGYNNRATFFRFEDTNVEIQFMLDIDKLKVTLEDADNAAEDQSSTDAMTTGSIIYLCLFCDGVTTYAGWTVGTKPTDIAHFDAGKLLTFTALFDNFATLSSPDQSSIFAASSGSSRWIPGSAYALVASSTCPIVT